MDNSIAQRQHMVLGQLYTNDIEDPRILRAMAEIPREDFLPPQLQGAAYVDEDIEIAPGRWLMEPLTFAMLLDLAQLTAESRVLVVGCLSGYSAAVIARITGHVVAIDTDAAWLEEAQAHMGRLAVANVRFAQVASLAEGYATSAPYDAIVIAGAVEYIPEALAAQLAPQGRIVTVRRIADRPGLQGGLGKGLLVERIDQRLQYREHFDASCAVLPGFEHKPGFSF